MLNGRTTKRGSDRPGVLDYADRQRRLGEEARLNLPSALPARQVAFRRGGRYARDTSRQRGQLRTPVGMMSSLKS